MTDSAINQSIAKLRLQVEAHLGWGQCGLWSNYDFEKLSEQIAEKTGVNLSVSTLKRVLGKINSKSDPSLTTLNALSQYLQYTDWRAFVQQNSENLEAQEPARTEPTAEMPARNLSRFRPSRFALPAVLLSLVLALAAYFVSKKPEYQPNDFSFSSKTILTEGLPNSVIFDFEVSNARDKDSVFICQLWDDRRKVLVNKHDRHHSAIYYYPGYFRAKLMIGDIVMREHDLQINTDSWLGVVEADWGVEPLYFKKSDIEIEGGVAVTDSLLEKYKLDLAPQPLKIRFFNQKDIRDIYTDNFTFETWLKNDFSAAGNACQRAEVLLQAKNEIIIIPLSNPACVGDLFFTACGYSAHSSREDLSGFGCDLNAWTKLRVECRQGSIAIFINKKPAYKAKIRNKPVEIVGVQVSFLGTGTLKNTWLEGAGGKVQF